MVKFLSVIGRAAVGGFPSQTTRNAGGRFALYPMKYAQVLGAFYFVVVIFSAQVFMVIYLSKIFGIASLVLAWISNEIHYKVRNVVFVHSKIPQVQLLKFWNGSVISSHTGYVITYPRWDLN